MKFNITFNKSAINDNKVDEQVAKKVAEQAADEAYKIGKAEGWVWGGLFVAGVYLAVDALCGFIGDGNESK